MAKTAHVLRGSAAIMWPRSSLAPIPAPHLHHERVGDKRKSNFKIKVDGEAYKVSEVFHTFFWFVCERHRAFLRRLADHEFPWTEDTILASHPFVNVFRVFDRNTQYILQHIIGDGNAFTLRDAFFRVVLFRTFNKIETWQHLEKKLGTLTAENFDVGKYDSVLSKAMDSGIALYNSAYIMPAPPLGQLRNCSNHLRLIDVMLSLKVYDKLKKMKHLKDAHGYITLFPSMGDFMAMQLVLDLNMLPYYDWSEDEWVALGPGSTACLHKMFGADIRGHEEAAIRHLRDEQFIYFQRFGLTADQMPQLCQERTPGLSMVDIEHALCECEKYSRAAFPHIRGKRVSAGRQYVPKDEPVTAVVPKKWRQPQKEMRWSEPSALDGIDLYEVEHIVKEVKMKASKDGGTRYHIRWRGWGPEHDTVVPEAELSDAGELLTAWKALKDEIVRALEERVKY